MTTDNSTPRAMLWAGWVLSGLLIVFMIFDTTIKLADLDVVKQTMVKMGIPPGLDRTIGIIELICLVLYIFPRTAVLGAILLTAIFGGAIASHMRIGSPLLGYTLFGVYLGLMAWGGLWLRDRRLRAMIPLRRSA
jgi:hypothetical protein